jgi:hypothetical protein
VAAAVEGFRCSLVVCNCKSSRSCSEIKARKAGLGSPRLMLYQQAHNHFKITKQPKQNSVQVRTPSLALRQRQTQYTTSISPWYPDIHLCLVKVDDMRAHFIPWHEHQRVAAPARIIFGLRLVVLSWICTVQECRSSSNCYGCDKFARPSLSLVHSYVLHSCVPSASVRLRSVYIGGPALLKTVQAITPGILDLAPSSLS